VGTRAPCAYCNSPAARAAAIPFIASTSFAFRQRNGIGSVPRLSTIMKPLRVGTDAGHVVPADQGHAGVAGAHDAMLVDGEFVGAASAAQQHEVRGRRQRALDAQVDAHRPADAWRRRIR
jgi:hypothetical protein